MWQTFEQSLNRYHDLARQLGDPGVIADRARFTQVAKEHGSLAKFVKPYIEYREVSDELAQNEALLAVEADPAMRGYLEEELTALRARRERLQTRMEDLLLVEP